MGEIVGPMAAIEYLMAMHSRHEIHIHGQVPNVVLNRGQGWEQYPQESEYQRAMRTSQNVTKPLASGMMTALGAGATLASQGIRSAPAQQLGSGMMNALGAGATLASQHLGSAVSQVSQDD